MRTAKIGPDLRLAERVNHKQSCLVLAGTPVKQHLKKGLVRRSPLYQQRSGHKKNGGNRGTKKPVTASEQGSNGATAIKVNTVRSAREPMLSQSVWCSCLRA